MTASAKTTKGPGSNELRSLFLQYFEKQGHTIVPSSSLVPGNDPTLLFTNAGMVQFKDVFLGKDKRNYVRAVSSQRCVRAGGKHNDLENVGYTARHHTFFEMLGNFSFGDYFKRDAIRFAWELVTAKNWLGLDPKRLMVTVYKTDDEAYDAWHKDIGLAPDRVVRIGDQPGGGSDNFWQMGETGPCGPCSEIFYDHGPGLAGGPPGSADADGDRWVEIWNLVFMQFDRSADGVLTPLPKPSVDTGMGLERLAAVMQGVHSNYDIDLFRDLIRAAAQLAGTKDLASSSLRVIADHIRACSFLIVDGVLPANEGRGYVLRRIIRRAIRHGYQLGIREPFFFKLVAPLEREMGAAYPELTRGRQHVERVLEQEELRFAETLATGMGLLEEAIRGARNKTIPGEAVFKLYDTYGFPVDLTADMARERGLTIDQAGFETAMAAQRERARAASKFGVDLRGGVTVEGRTEFSGYEGIEDQGRVAELIKAGAKVDRLRAGEEGQVVLDRTPFYAEAGGQVGDQGRLTAPGVRFDVLDTQKLGNAHAHIGKLVQGEIKAGDTLTAQVDGARRRATMLNHTATHLLHAALRQVLGTHVTQKGSLVAPDRLRFDFSHYQAVSAQELTRIERMVNAQIRENAPADINVMAFDQAVAAGAMALFGEKYESDVRVLKIGEFSMELCGGTHVKRAGDIGFFKIIAESGIAAGVRRIEALTGEDAVAWAESSDVLLREVGSLVRGGREDLKDKVEQLLERSKKLEKEIQQLKGRLASGQGGDLSSAAREINGVKVLATRVDGADAKALRDAVDQLKSKLKSAVVVLASVESDDKVLLVAGVTQDQTSKIKAGELIGNVAQQVGGRGGGRPDMAQAGGTNPAALDAALASVEPWVRERLGA
ncbi:MAG TPA: alanine--tRNA ligase [Steroidobacteraceae bacterium]|nr:alanine--tRNA ligase [Steroidobacteraceae bacterium]